MFSTPIDQNTKNDNGKKMRIKTGSHCIPRMLLLLLLRTFDKKQ